MSTTTADTPTTETPTPRPFDVPARAETKPARKPRKASTKASTKAPAKRATKAKAGGSLTFPAAAEKVLRDADGPMKVGAIAELAVPMTATKGKTPTATLGARLITDANRGGTFVKVAPGTFDVRELNPRGAAKRPKRRS